MGLSLHQINLGSIKYEKEGLKAMSMMSIEPVCVIPSVTPGILIFLRCQFNIYLILLLIKQITF